MWNVGRLSLAVLAVATASASFAQTPKTSPTGTAPADNPLVTISKKIGETGFAAGDGPKASPLKFKRSSDRIFIRKYLASIYGSGAELEQMEKAVAQVVESFEASAKEAKVADDGAAAMAFSVGLLYAVVYSAEVEGAAIEDLEKRFRATFDTDTVKKATDLQKQEFYEWALASSATVIALAAGAESPEQIGQVQALATLQIRALIGADVANLVLRGKSATLRPVKPKDGG